MATDNQTKLIIELETILRGLDKTLRGLSQVEKKLKAVAAIKPTGQTAAGISRATQATQRLQQQQQRAALSAQRLAQQQQALNLRAQQLANTQTRVAQTTQRLALAQQRLNQQTAAGAVQLGQQANAHVVAFRAIQHASQQTQRTILGVGNALRSVGQGLASLGATLTVSVTAPLVAVGVASVDAAVRLDSLRRGLAAIVGSADEAARQLRRLTQLAKLPGIGFEEAIQGSIRLQAVGFSAAEAERNLREFANAIALTGGGRDELARVTIQLGQLAAKGKVLSQDLRPIIEAAPAVGRALLQAFGTVNSEDIQELGLSTRQFLGILVDELSRLPRAAAGAKNSFENFRDEVFRAAAAVGEALLPGLIRLVEVVGPVITRLADTFARLPQPVQLVVIGIGALLAALGPVVFVVGQLTLGVGRLLVGFVELNLAGIGPTIANLRRLTAGTLGAAAAQRTLAASSALLIGTIGGVVAVLGAVVTAYAVYNAFQKDAAILSKERADQLTAEIKSLEEQAKFLSGLQAGVERTADEQERLSDIYNKLNTEAQIRVAGITDEEKRLIALRAELEKLIELRGQERIQQAASVAASIAAAAETIAANNRSRDSISQRIAANNALVETLEREGRITQETGQQLERLGQTAGGDVRQAIAALQAESARLVGRQRELGDNTEETRDELEQYLAVLRALDPRQQLTARQLLTLAKNMGLFKGNVEEMVPVLEDYIKRTDEAANATERLNRALSPVAQSLLKSGEGAERAAKARRELIEAAAAQAREISVDFEGALRDIRRTVDAVPELRQALERESELTGKSMETLLREALEKAFGRARDKSGTGLRNAQEQLAQALAEVAEASAEELATKERLKNEALLTINENAFRLQLRAYRQYLSERARLTNANLQLEIQAQQKIIDDATAERERFLQRAGTTRLPAAERERARAGAASADEQVIKARTKILELQQKQRDLATEVSQALAESAKQQLDDINKLEIELAELRGSIEAAANAATDTRFREELQRLAIEQAHLNELERTFADILSREDKEEIALAKARNQRQIEAITAIRDQQDALASLAAAEELVRQAKERQQRLEQDLTFEVEFRGLREEQAIERRLAGEQRLNAALGNAHETIRQIVAALQARGVEPPRALLEFLANLRTEVQGLGELPFSEQFRLAEKEFTRLNDERLQRIADVERAVRNRTIAEAEGLLLIRRINGEYVDDLQQQVDLLKQIAVESGRPELQQQAADAAEVAKDAADQLASVEKELRATAIDTLPDALSQFFNDLRDQSSSVLDDLLGLLDNFASQLANVIIENFSRRIIESILGEGDILAAIKGIFGGGGEAQAGAVGAVAGALGGATDATVAATALQTGATVAATTLQAGATAAAATDTASAVTFATAITTAATTFAAAVVAAGAAFAAAVAGGGTAGGLEAIGEIGFATGDILPARPGGRLVRVAEGGHPEAILTTDPRHALRQARLLTRFLRATHGLGGRFPVPHLASGALVSPLEAEGNMLAGIARGRLSNRNIGDARLAAAGVSQVRLRQVLTDERNAGDWLQSSEGERVFRTQLTRNAPTIQRLSGGRR